eukprot:6135436-Amphidinium_carterae.1
MGPQMKVCQRMWLPNCIWRVGSMIAFYLTSGLVEELVKLSVRRIAVGTADYVARLRACGHP